MSNLDTVCIASILREEERFVDEWLAYHRMLGVDHFYLYDDDPRNKLRESIRLHGDYVTVVPWFGKHEALPGRNRQTKAYTHWLSKAGPQFEWVCFLDLDEFVVLRRHSKLKSFLGDVGNCDSVSLFWRNFGHNGYYEDPPDLVTESLTRRKRQSGRQYKSITRTTSIQAVESAHRCVLRPGASVCDANGRRFSSDAWTGDHDGVFYDAYVNHYYCRSFAHWMNRPRRGATTDNENLASEAWKLEPEACLRQFVETVSVEFNEQTDESMKVFAEPIHNYLSNLNRERMGR